MLARIGWLLYLPTFSKDNDAKKYCILEAEGRERYLLVFFVCLFVALLYSVLFPLIFAEPFFFVTDFVSVLPRGTNSYSLFSSAEKNG